MDAFAPEAGGRRRPRRRPAMTRR